MPATLHQQLNDYERERHAERMSEIKRSANRLRMFEPTFVALKDRGLDISLNWPLGNHNAGLRITRGGTTSHDTPIYDALLELGFVEVPDQRWGNSYISVYLRKGRLTVCVVLDADELRKRETKLQTSAQEPAEAACL